MNKENIDSFFKNYDLVKKLMKNFNIKLNILKELLV